MLLACAVHSLSLRQGSGLRAKQDGDHDMPMVAPAASVSAVPAHWGCLLK